MSSERWCQIFDTEKHGQVLIQKETNEKDELAVKTTFECSIGQVSFSISIKKSDTEEESQGKLFNGMNIDSVSDGVTNIKRELEL